LTDVTYPMLEFSVDADAADSVTAIFDQRRVEHATRARVSGLLTDLG
jgi:tRNA pseudouridine38-40 synthase